MKKIFWGFVVLALFGEPVLAQKNKSLSVKVSGAVADGELKGEKVIIDIFENYAQFGEWPAAQHITAEIKNNGFSVESMLFQHPGYIQITLPKPYYTEVTSTLFLFEPGDLLSFELKDGAMKFVGRDAPKFNCQLEMVNIKLDLPPGFAHLDSIYFSNSFKAYDNWVDRNIHFIDSNSGRLGASFVGILKANIIARAESYKLLALKECSRSDDAITSKNAKLYFSKFVPKEFKSDSLSSILLNSSSYVDYLFLKEICDLEIPSTSQSRKRYGFNELFDNILKKYTGDLRDRILLSSVTASLSSRDSTDFYQVIALNTVTDSFSREILLSYKKIFMKGAVAYNFQLTDTLGKSVKLSDFKGKLVILDFYFTGCTGCVNVNKGMGPVKQKYSDNNKVVFISINIDKSFLDFKKAVKSGRYTHEGNVNLYTNGLGDQHPLIQYYNFKGYPVLMIIDKTGAILNSSPPYPLLNRPDLIDGFSAIIDHELTSDLN